MIDPAPLPLALLAHVKGYNVLLDGVNVNMGWSIWLHNLAAPEQDIAFEGDSEDCKMADARAIAEDKARAYLDEKPTIYFL